MNSVYAAADDKRATILVGRPGHFSSFRHHQSLVVPYQLSKNTSKPTCSNSRNLKPPAPLHPQTLWCYINAVLLLLLYIILSVYLLMLIDT